MTYYRRAGWFWGLARCLQACAPLPCCEPPSPLRDPLGLGDAVRASALLMPSIPTFSRRVCSWGTPADTPRLGASSERDWPLHLLSPAYGRVACTEGPSVHVWLRTEQVVGKG